MIRQNKERIKTALIVLLSITAVLFGHLTGLFGMPFSNQPNATRTLPTLHDQIPIVRPVAAMATISADARLGLIFDPLDDTVSVQSLFHQFTPALTSALVEVDQFYPTPNALWRTAMQQPGIFFSFPVAAPLTLAIPTLSEGAALQNQLVTRLLLTQTDDGLWLYYQDETGASFRAHTTLPPSTLEDNLGNIPTNNAKFQFETSDYTGANPYEVILPYYTNIPGIVGFNTINDLLEELDAVLPRFGIQRALMRYLDEGGKRTIVQGDITLTLSDQGRIHFTDPTGTPQASPTSLVDAIQTANQLVDVIRLTAQAGEIYLTGWQEDNGRITVTFGYTVSGLPVFTEHPAATIVIDRGIVTEASLLARGFFPTSETIPAMPHQFAQRAAGDVPIALHLIPETQSGALFGAYFTPLQARWMTIPTNREQGGA